MSGYRADGWAIAELPAKEVAAEPAPTYAPVHDGRTFDRILFLQSFGYAKDPVHTFGPRERC